MHRCRIQTMKILADASLPHLSTWFAPAFHITRYHSQDEVIDLLPAHDILLCRSTLKVTAELLANTAIQCVATASSGIDHIDADYLSEQGITLVDAKGCNARAVADYVVATLALCLREKRVFGKTAGVIGVGEVGSRVVKRLQAAGFHVICFDPLRRARDSDYHFCSLEALASCDLVCIHANLHDTPPYPSVNLLGAAFLRSLKPGTVIINAARGGIVNEVDLLQLATPLTYCTDVYANEPAINPLIVDYAMLCTPHIAGHSLEAKQDAIIQISEKLHHHYGFLQPSVNKRRSTKGLVLSPHDSWQDCILSLYNPLMETLALKKAPDKQRAFLSLRKAHLTTHNFNVYDARHLPKQTSELLGNLTDRI